MKTELLPALGLPTTAMVPLARRCTMTLSIGTAVSTRVAIAYYLRDVEMPRLLPPERNRGAIDPKLERIPAERAAEERELRTLDEAEHHEALDGWILGIDRDDANEITSLQI